MNVPLQLADQRQLVALALHTTSAHTLDAFLKRWLAPSFAFRPATAVRQGVQTPAGATATQPPHYQSIRMEGQGTRLDMPEPGRPYTKQQSNKESYQWHMVQQEQDKA
jgi:hypothetical protein